MSYEEEKYVHMMATNKKREIYVAVVHSRHTEVADKLFDGGYQVGQCAEWHYNQKSRDGATTYHIDEETEFIL